MTDLASVFVVQHVHVHEDGEECVKMIGVYASEAAAEEAVRRVADQPGFRDWPLILDARTFDVDASGFFITEYAIGKDHWTEGYVTMTLEDTRRSVPEAEAANPDGRGYRQVRSD